MEFEKGKIIYNLINKIIPKLNQNQIKGENGNVATIGGSLEYSGAPYYSAITSLKAGSDLSHVFCHTDSCIAIKSYSPELIVHPAFNNNENEDLLKKSIRWFKSMDSIVFGPGLGREEDIEKIFVEFSNKISELDFIPLIYDADGIYFYNKFFKELKINKNLILTPNNSEYLKLCNQLGNKFNVEKNKVLYNEIEKLINNKNNNNDENNKKNNNDIDNNNNNNNNNYNNENIIFIDFEKQQELKEIFLNEINLCNLFNNCILVKKGKYDIITNGKIVYIVYNLGSLKRSGGIGDILGGFINSYCGIWAKKCKIEKNKLKQEDLIECVVLGCYFCRKYSKLAYDKKLYSLTAPDIINFIDGNYYK